MAWERVTAREVEAIVYEGNANGIAKGCDGVVNVENRPAIRVSRS